MIKTSPEIVDGKLTYATPFQIKYFVPIKAFSHKNQNLKPKTLEKDYGKIDG